VQITGKYRTPIDRANNQPRSSSQTVGIASHVEGKGNKIDEGIRYFKIF
jgi:hypothetical protein